MYSPSRHARKTEHVMAAFPLFVMVTNLQTTHLPRLLVSCLLHGTADFTVEQDIANVAAYTITKPTYV